MAFEETPEPVKFKAERFVKKVMEFWNYEEVILIDFLESKKTFTSSNYEGVLKKLKISQHPPMWLVQLFIMFHVREMISTAKWKDNDGCLKALHPIPPFSPNKLKTTDQVGHTQKHCVPFLKLPKVRP